MPDILFCDLHAERQKLYNISEGMISTKSARVSQ